MGTIRTTLNVNVKPGKKLTESELDELVVDEIEDLPHELRMAIRESIQSEYTGGEPSVLTGQSYKPTDYDDFPVGMYIVNKTGRSSSAFFRISDEFQIKQEEALDVIDGLGFTEVFNKEMYMKSGHFQNKIYEKVYEDGIILLMVDSIAIKWAKSVSKSYRQDRSINISLAGNASTKDFNGVTSLLTPLAKTRRERENNIALVIQTNRGYDTTTFELPKQKLDIELGYGKGFKPIHEKIIHKLNEPKSKGLVLLHGTPGTGKTHYLKYLASKIKNKRVLFIPPFLADFITSPEMTPFLIQNAGSVLFIEDAERVITDRNNGGGNGVSNILNITDGILSDILNIQIVATFNMDKAKIDSALLRKGRLIAEHKFDALPIEDAQSLIDSLGYKHTADKPMTLTEIYNLSEVEYKSEDKGRPSIGFNRY
jgi:SpoVK/Ycf46/Vps4 family AAA+-type ATPase